MKKLLLVLALFVTSIGYTQDSEIAKEVTKQLELAKQTTTEVKAQLSGIEDVVKPYVKDFLEATKDGAKFLAKETPLVIQEYVVFEAVSLGLILLLGLMLIFGARPLINIFVLKKSVEDPRKDSESRCFYYEKKGADKWLRRDGDSGDVSVEEVLYWVVPALGWLSGTIVILVHITDFVKVAFFPKLFLVEKFIELI